MGGCCNRLWGPLRRTKSRIPHPRGGPLAKISQGPVDAYLPGEEPLKTLSPHPPPPKGTPHNQDRVIAHPGHLSRLSPPPLLLHTGQ